MPALGMSMSHSCSQRMSMRQTHALKQEQRLELAQRLEQNQLLVANRRHVVFQDLLFRIRGEHYQPTATCPKCSTVLQPAEIIKGFTTDPNDFTTECPHCKTRFETTMLSRQGAVSVEFRFYCASQTLGRLRGKEGLTLEELKKGELLPIYQSAVYHFGSVTNAFKQLNLQYRFERLERWETKVHPFLGRLPDSEIASVVNVLPECITKMRREFKIKLYSPRRELSFTE